MGIERWESELMVDGLPVKVTEHARREMDELNLSIYDIISIMNVREDCPDSKSRKRGTMEVCGRFGRHHLKIVYIDGYSINEKINCWTVIHIGKTGRK